MHNQSVDSAATAALEHQIVGFLAQPVLGRGCAIRFNDRKLRARTSDVGLRKDPLQERGGGAALFFPSARAAAWRANEGPGAAPVSGRRRTGDHRRTRRLSVYRP